LRSHQAGHATHLGCMREDPQDHSSGRPHLYPGAVQVLREAVGLASRVRNYETNTPSMMPFTALKPGGTKDQSRRRLTRSGQLALSPNPGLSLHPHNF
jgi:hypothetical protein